MEHLVDNTACSAHPHLPAEQVGMDDTRPSGPFFPPAREQLCPKKVQGAQPRVQDYLQFAVVHVWFFGSNSAYVKESLTRKGNISKVVASFCNQLFSRLAIMCLMRRLFPVTNE